MDQAKGARKLAASALGWMPTDSLAPGRRSKEGRPARLERRLRTSNSSERWRLLIIGNVQGVGYRATCRDRARDLGLAGWVQNRPDGSVEVQAEGDPQQLEALRLWCERGPTAAFVSGVSVSQMGPTGTDWFEVRF